MPAFRIAPCLLGVVLAGCSPYHFAGESVLSGLSDEELCGRRSNLLNGALMARELARRGVDCAPFDEAGLRRGFHIAFLTPRPAGAEPASSSTTPDQAIPEPAASAPASPSPAEVATERGGDPSAGGPPAPQPPASVAPASVAPTSVTPAGLAPADPLRRNGEPARPATAAPLVTSACAERSVRSNRAEPTDDAARQGEAVFRNTCGFPVRVSYMQSPAGAFTGVTSVLRPGEASSPAPIQSGFDKPGYIVCSYETVPQTMPCRLPSSH